MKRESEVKVREEEQVVAYFRVVSRNSLGGTEGNHNKFVSIAGTLAKIRGAYLQNLSRISTIAYALIRKGFCHPRDFAS
jgi:hypothetical protein